MNERNERLAEQAFVVCQASKGLAQSVPARSATRPVMYAEILHYVLGNNNIDVNKVSGALGSNLSNRRVFNQLLSQNRRAYAPREAHAQDTDVVDQRIGQGFKIKFRPAKSRPDQLYVILEIDYQNLLAGDKPLILHISGSANASDEGAEQIYLRMAFPAQIENKTQLVVASEDPRLLSLRNMDTELSLV